jgi:ABC-2 type transport system ATP-binding protein
MLTVKNLSKRFGSLTAVDSVSFRVQPGEVFGLLGPNGAGKSTTINMIVGVLVPDGGAVEINSGGSPVDPGVRRNIGNAPQSLAIYGDLTAEENLRFFGRLYGLTGARLRERVDWSLELAALTDRKGDRVDVFSGGMQRRLNLACALVHDPSLVLLDEPTAGVDPQSRNMIFEKIELMKSEGRAVVYTTHYMEEAQRLCDRVAIIDHGRILDLDSVDALIDRHGGISNITIELDPDAAIPTDLPGRIEDHFLRLESDRPLEQIAQISARGLVFRSLHVERPDLERVFLNLTGRRLRD